MITDGTVQADIISLKDVANTVKSMKTQIDALPTIQSGQTEFYVHKSDSYQTVEFPKEFKNVPHVTITPNIRDANYWAAVSYSVTEITTSGFTINTWCDVDVDIQNYPFQWIAVS